MDKIVSQYTRSPEQNEFLAEQQELTESTPPLSLKFNLPPLDNVSYQYPETKEEEYDDTNEILAGWFPPCYDR